MIFIDQIDDDDDGDDDDDDDFVFVLSLISSKHYYQKFSQSQTSKLSQGSIKRCYTIEITTKPYPDSLCTKALY